MFKLSVAVVAENNHSLKPVSNRMRTRILHEPVRWVIVSLKILLGSTELVGAVGMLFLGEFAGFFPSVGSFR